MVVVVQLRPDFNAKDRKRLGVSTLICRSIVFYFVQCLNSCVALERLSSLGDRYHIGMEHVLANLAPPTGLVRRSLNLSRRVTQAELP